MQDHVAVSAQITGTRRHARSSRGVRHSVTQTGGVNDPQFGRGAATRGSQGGRSRHGSFCVDVCAPFAGGIERHPKLEAPVLGSRVRTMACLPPLVADLKLRRRFTRSAALVTAEAKYVRTLWPPLWPHPRGRDRSRIRRRLCGTKWAWTAGRERPPGTGPGRRRRSQRGVAHAPTAITTRLPRAARHAARSRVSLTRPRCATG